MSQALSSAGGKEGDGEEGDFEGKPPGLLCWLDMEHTEGVSVTSDSEVSSLSGRESNRELGTWEENQARG